MKQLYLPRIATSKWSNKFLVISWGKYLFSKTMKLRCKVNLDKKFISTSIVTKLVIPTFFGFSIKQKFRVFSGTQGIGNNRGWLVFVHYHIGFEIEFGMYSVCKGAGFSSSLIFLFTFTAEGQIISKCLFDLFNFSVKTNKTKSTWGIIVSSKVRFLGELRIPKSTFEINWPLDKYDWDFKRMSEFNYHPYLHL